MTSSLHHLTSWQGSSHFRQVIQSVAFPPKHTHAHGYEFQNIPPFSHSSSRFWRGNILDASVTLYLGYLGLLYITPCLLQPHVYGKCFCTFRTTLSMSSHATILQIIPHFDIQMTTWSFRDALEELGERGHFNESVLWSALGLCLGDIRFAEIQTSIKMHAVRFSMFLQYVEEGFFNPDHLAPHGCSQTMAILLAFIPDRHLEDIENDWNWQCDSKAWKSSGGHIIHKHSDWIYLLRLRDRA